MTRGLIACIAAVFDAACRSRNSFPDLLIDHVSRAVTIFGKCRTRGVLARMTASGVRPQEREYGALIMAHGAAGDLAAARAVLPEMRAHGVEPNTFTYTNLIGWRTPCLLLGLTL